MSTYEIKVRRHIGLDAFEQVKRVRAKDGRQAKRELLWQLAASTRIISCKKVA